MYLVARMQPEWSRGKGDSIILIFHRSASSCPGTPGVHLRCLLEGPHSLLQSSPCFHNLHCQGSAKGHRDPPSPPRAGGTPGSPTLWRHLRAARTRPGAYRLLGSSHRDGQQPPAAGRLLEFWDRSLRGVGSGVPVQLVAHKADEPPARCRRDAQLAPAPPPPSRCLRYGPLVLLPAGEGPARHPRSGPRRPSPRREEGLLRGERRRQPRRRPQEPPQRSHSGSCGPSRGEGGRVGRERRGGVKSREKSAQGWSRERTSGPRSPRSGFRREQPWDAGVRRRELRSRPRPGGSPSCFLSPATQPLEDRARSHAIGKGTQAWGTAGRRNSRSRGCGVTRRPSEGGPAAL